MEDPVGVIDCSCAKRCTRPLDSKLEDEPVHDPLVLYKTDVFYPNLGLERLDYPSVGVGAIYVLVKEAPSGRGMLLDVGAAVSQQVLGVIQQWQGFRILSSWGSWLLMQKEANRDLKLFNVISFVGVDVPELPAQEIPEYTVFKASFQGSPSVTVSVKIVCILSGANGTSIAFNMRFNQQGWKVCLVDNHYREVIDGPVSGMDCVFWVTAPLHLCFSSSLAFYPI